MNDSHGHRHRVLYCTVSSAAGLEAPPTVTTTDSCPAGTEIGTVRLICKTPIAQLGTPM
jgi:hypothetical protein